MAPIPIMATLGLFIRGSDHGEDEYMDGGLATRYALIMSITVATAAGL
jgi:hypothetical protein